MTCGRWVAFYSMYDKGRGNVVREADCRQGKGKGYRGREHKQVSHRWCLPPRQFPERIKQDNDNTSVWMAKQNSQQLVSAHQIFVILVSSSTEHRLGPGR
jgi:hypothetical protein